MEKFLEAVMRSLQGTNPAGELPAPAQKAKEALVLLYEYIVERAKTDEPLPTQADEVPNVSLIQQVICFTPLRLFLQVLAVDEQVQIRAGAKGELADRTGQYWNDPEVSLVAEANLVAMICNLSWAKQAWEKIEAESRVQQAYTLWLQSGCKTPFQPQLVVKEL